MWTEKIIIIQGPFHLPQLFPQRKYRGKQRFSYYEFLFRIYKVIFFNWPPFVQYQNEKRPTSQTEALLDEGFHGRAFFNFGTELGWQVEKITMYLKFHEENMMSQQKSYMMTMTRVKDKEDGQ